MKRNLAVVGLQRGDEGKGKLVDLLSQGFDCVVRYQGGHNAGHTVRIGLQIHKLHLIPSGIFRFRTQCVIGGGVVLDPTAFMEEADKLQMLDLTGRLFVSDRAHLIMPWHPKIEKAQAVHYGQGKVGTTQRGIGPAYEDKAGRRGFRAVDILNGEKFEERVYDEWPKRNKQLYGHEVSEPELQRFLVSARKLAPFIYDTRVLLNRIIRQEKSVLFEGAQAFGLDLDHGVYPYVTSSNPTVGGISTGTGVAAKYIHSVLGVVKAYKTSVGGGYFLTIDAGEDGRHMYQAGEEVGTSTGRDRDCGWFDAVEVRDAVMINGVDALAVMKLDVLTGLSKIRICTHYMLDGKAIYHTPADADALARCVPFYVVLPGWTENISSVRSFPDLPRNAQEFLLRLQDICEVPIKIISVGPERNQTTMISNVAEMEWMDRLAETSVVV